MPRTLVQFYQSTDKKVPVKEWLEDLKRRDRAAFAKADAVMSRLRDEGHELRRPTADFLRDGIYELRFKKGRVQYRILYYFAPKTRNLALLAHAIQKEGQVENEDIEIALQRKGEYERNPQHHTYTT